MNEHDVSFRHLFFDSDSVGRVDGMSLWYKTKTQALELFDFIHRYITAPGLTEKNLELYFTSDDENHYSLYFEIEIQDKVHSSNIAGIEKKYIDMIVTSLKKVPYYFIGAGYHEEKDSEILLPLSEYHFFRSYLSVDNDIIRGTRNPSWPLNIFKESNV